MLVYRHGDCLNAPCGSAPVHTGEGGIMTTIVNLTPHALNLFRENGEQVVIESTGLARCTVTTRQVGTCNGIRVNESQFGEVTGLPEPQADTVYVVSAMVLTALHGTRPDVLGLSEYVRNEAGQVVGAKALTH